MENLIESHERTLVIFDSVCSGLVECLSLVHSDIKEMTKHRIRQHNLSNLELLDKQLADSLSQASIEQHQHQTSHTTKEYQNQAIRLPSLVSPVISSSSTSSSSTSVSNLANMKNNNNNNKQSHQDLDNSQLQSSITHQSSRPSIFQVLLGKRSSSRGSSARSLSRSRSSSSQPSTPISSSSIDNDKLIIDDINKQIRLAMQYSKQLEAHLLKIEGFRTRYEMHLKMVQVVKRIFVENVAKLESEFEQHMGSFLFSIEDIQGFARVCAGDTFEISIKYGDSQKFKTRISVLKGNRQKCDHRQTVFKAKIADRLAIKAYECKGLGKRVLLGHKLCETRDLFTARSQLMTISLNQLGSIKLNLIVTWNPLHMAPNNGPAGVDISHISLSESPIYT